ncbi:MAG: trypsin-like peptidase domain-containing protein [Planctomycetes bacterium]|nr:trypsin-like peptidase domain-containing protein [Planctomycetota bacterium]MBI3833274.1 trypsin-like peptidase domain-containing protein [Planctomycetota bacterium]
MRAQLIYLSGPLRGRTITYRRPVLIAGSGANCDIRFRNTPSVAAKHAEIRFQQEGCCFLVKALDGAVFVNTGQVSEVILEPDDLIEFGLGGPKARFRIFAAEGEVCKPVYLMMNDAQDVRRESGWWASARALSADLIWRAKRPVRIGIVAALIAAAIIGGVIGGSIVGSRSAHRQEMLSQKLVAKYEQQLNVLERQIAAFQRDQAGRCSRDDIEKLKAEMAGRVAMVDALADQDAALKRVLDVYSRGVCLIHGAYSFTMQQDEQTIPLTASDGSLIAVEYLGSGFLASADGDIITNRHIGEPWWNSEASKTLIDKGFVPHFMFLNATFPGKPPTTIDPKSIHISTDGVDVATMRVQVESVPVLPLATEKQSASRGERVIVLGYPTGLNAILARMESDAQEKALAKATDTTTLIAQLAEMNAISPVITQGALNDVLERRLVYDAETTSGGSGGPVFGSKGVVIGVNFAITRDFQGSNFGVPIRFAIELLENEKQVLDGQQPALQDTHLDH